MPLPNGRRADMVALDANGPLTIVEIKVSRADLLGDGKWCDYLDYCDYFYLGGAGRLRPGAVRGRACFRPDLRGLIVADRYDADVVREAPHAPARRAARRKAETLRFARRAARRLVGRSRSGRLAGLSI